METVVNNTGDLRNILVNNGLDVHKFDVVGALSDIQFRMGQPVQVVEMTDVQQQKKDSMPSPTT